MASTYSFDVVSDFDHQEMVNTVDQTMREIKNRYDLKSTDSKLDLGENEITIETDSEMTLDTINDILRQKAAKRGLSQKIFEAGKIESASGGRVRQVVTLKRGIEKDLAKTITKLVRDNVKKAQASIQGDAVRVSSKSKDDLQTVMQVLKEEDFPVALQFTNYR
ncbi:YajQ family cyclic di-GMP-binding protein [Spirulina sp. CS-785/01]|uniref:YajQ family cyclic di-GMP-binding protein n=1 Tax=Spirulina sp. CS-785/01 TaxID=3021716 RepID=UPI00232F3F6F|nr:YajQ family cyclic di-GMP-binding protein [Spirulina sp. CS-785/01]MDB9313782.1 YajQ family cyclic di-GMP-binding protein [Spirulina sp. CS-785/01]